MTTTQDTARTAVALASEVQHGPIVPQRVSLVAKIAERYSVEPERMLVTLKATAFKSDKPISNEQMMALLIVADQYRLNPFTKEIFAFPDKGGIVPVVSVDGWARIINEHPMFDGVNFEWEGMGAELACTAVIYRKDRSHPIRVTEYMNECKRGTQPWNSHPRRMLRHKALIQCARLAFGFAGIYDQDEAERIVHGGNVERVEPASASAQRVRAALGHVPAEPASFADVAEADFTPPPAEPAQAQPNVALLEEYRQHVLNARDAETAGLALDEARDVLTEDEHTALVAVYRGKWNSKE